jgi:hypothetical protein
MYLPNGELSRAVLIGTGDFQSPDLPQLPAVNNNLFGLFQALTDPETGILPESRCTIVQSPDSPDSFMQRLRRSVNEAEDLLLVYYAGHGLRHERRDDLYLAVRQTNPSGLDGTAVEYEWVRDAIADSPARTRLLILDCCYSGLALDRMSAAGVDGHDIEVSGTSVLASSPRNKQSHSPAGERFTAFTGELLTLLRNGPSLAGQPLTVLNAFRSIKAGLTKRELPSPILRSDDTSGQVLLRKQTQPRRQPAAPPPPKPVVRPIQPSPPLPLPPHIPVSPVGRMEVEPTVQVAPVLPPPLPIPLPSRHRSPAALSREIRIPSRESLARASRGVASGAVKGTFWLLVIFGVGSMLGSLAGVIFGPADKKAGDLSVLLIGVVVLAFPVLFLILAFRRSRPPRSLRSTVKAILPTFDKLPSIVLVVLVSLCGFVVLAGLLGGTQPSSRASTFSEAATGATTAAAMLQAAALFVHELLRRWKSAHEALPSDER